MRSQLSLLSNANRAERPDRAFEPSSPTSGTRDHGARRTIIDRLDRRRTMWSPRRSISVLNLASRSAFYRRFVAIY